MQILKGRGLFKKHENGKYPFAYDIYNRKECSVHNYESFTFEGFSKNVVAYRAVSLISKCVSSVEMVVSDERDKTGNSRINRLLKFPNPNQCLSRFLEEAICYLLISGNSYIYMSNDDDNELSMQVLRPDRVEIVPSSDYTSVGHYLYKVNGNILKIDDTDNIIHLKFFNPTNDWYGFSPLQAAAQSIDQHNAVSVHNLSILRNGGRPSGCLMIKSGTENLTDHQREELRKGIRESYAGTGNAGKIMVLEGDFDWQEIGKSPKDLDFFSGKNISAREIAQAYGIPPMLIGIQGDSTFANYKEARFHLWEDTILPLAGYLLDELNKWIHKNVSNRVNVAINQDKIPALSLKRDSLWDRLSNCDFLTVNEKRAFLGFPPIEAQV